MLVALSETAERVLAWEAPRGAPHRCPVCGDPVTLKRGQKVVSHFAHRPGAECANAGETRQHLEMKLAFYQAFAAVAAPEDVDLERPIGIRRADVWLRLATNREIAIECQHSAVPAEEATLKIADYAGQGVDCLYVVHAEAFPGYRRAAGIASLHGREISVPEWVRATATPDQATVRSYSGLENEPWVPYGRVFVHVWADGQLWALELTAVYRERTWGWKWDVEVLATKRDARLLGRIEPLTGPWMLEPEPRIASYAAVRELAAYDGTHPSVLEALAAARTAPVEAPRRRVTGGDPGCRPAAPTRPPASPPAAAASPPPTPEDPQLGFGLDTPAAQKPRRWADYD